MVVLRLQAHLELEVIKVLSESFFPSIKMMLPDRLNEIKRLLPNEHRIHSQPGI